MAKFKLYNSYEWLYQRFVVEKKTAEQMAAEANCTKQTIYIQLKKHSING